MGLACPTGAPGGLAGDTGSPVHRLDPRVKVVGALGVVLVSVSAGPSQWPVWAACAAVLACAAALARVPAAVVARRAAPVLPPVLLVAALAPLLAGGTPVAALGPLTVSDHGLTVLAGVAAKAAIGTATAVLLVATTTVPQVLHALERLRVPRLLTLIAAVMFRYLATVADEVRRMRTAMAARGARPGGPLGAAVLGRLAAALFLRSIGRGERVHRAMLSRGFAGAMPVVAPAALRGAEVLPLGAVLALLLAVRVGAGVAA